MELPPSVDRQGPTLAKLVEVGQILEEAQGEEPLSLSEINRRMQAKRTRHQTIRACVDFLENLGFVTTGSMGVQWTHVSPVSVKEAHDVEFLQSESTEDMREAGSLPHERAEEAFERQERWRALVEPIEAFYREFRGPVDVAQRVLVEDVDYQAALDHVETFEDWVEENEGLLNDVGADGRVRGSASLIIQLFKALSVAKEGLRDEDYDRGIEGLRTVRELIHERQKGELDALEDGRKYYVFDWEDP